MDEHSMEVAKLEGAAEAMGFKWKEAQVEQDRLRKENDVLRGLVAKLQVACVYCGLDDISRCVKGFPGCDRADDLMCGEDVGFKDAVGRMRALRAIVNGVHEAIGGHPGSDDASLPSVVGTMLRECKESDAQCERLRVAGAAENARLREALRRVVYEPQGPPDASHVYVLRSLVDIARAALEEKP